MKLKTLFIIVVVAVLLVVGLVLVSTKKDSIPNRDSSSVPENRIKHSSDNTRAFGFIFDIFSRTKAKERDGVIDPAELPVPDSVKQSAKPDDDVNEKMRSEGEYPLTKLSKSELNELYDHLDRQREDVIKQKELLESLNQELEKTKSTSDEKVIANLDDRIRKSQSYIKNMSSYIVEMEKKLAAAGLSTRKDKN